MYIVHQTEDFQLWLDKLENKRAQVRIAARLRQVEQGSLGDWKPVGEKVSEMRVDTGPGYRLYFTRQRRVIIVMLAGGSKSSQQRDIKRAQAMVDRLELD